MLAEAVFWGSSAMLAYTYLGYPALVWAWGRLRPRPVARADGFTPAVSVVVVLHDEAPRVAGRIENLLGLDYPPERLEIIVASDGSRDGTAERALAYQRARVEVIAFPTRRGKPAVLNEVVRRARGEIVVLADGRQRFDNRALLALTAPFADPGVGAVSGELILTAAEDSGAVGEGVGLYWRYEKLVRRNESRAGSSVGATGAIYAIRRSLFEPLPEDTILDDVLIPMRIARRGYRVVFESAARATDRGPATSSEEFARKVRTLGGNFQLFAREPWLLSPMANPLWCQTVSHKGLRLLTPLLLAAALASSLLLLHETFYRGLVAAQAAFYGAALAGYRLRGARRTPPLVGVPYVICLLSWAAVLGFVRFLTGRQRVTWEKLPRHAAQAD